MVTTTRPHRCCYRSLLVWTQHALQGYAVAIYLMFGRRVDLACSTDWLVINDRVSKEFPKLVRAEGLPHLTFHGLRHAHATLALSAGVNPKIVSERLGHSSISVTMDIYSHVLPGMQEEAALAVEQLLDRPASG